jgi:hypothetical protein
VVNLPPYQIPTQCSNSDILKNITINWNNLSFTRIFSYVKAHQDDGIKYGSLMSHAQLNCQMYYHAKKAIWETIPDPEAPTKQFPLKLIDVYLGKNKPQSLGAAATSTIILSQCGHHLWPTI